MNAGSSRRMFESQSAFADVSFQRQTPLAFAPLVP